MRGRSHLIHVQALNLKVFSLNGPSEPIQSLSCNVLESCVCLSVPSRKTNFTPVVGSLLRLEVFSGSVPAPLGSGGEPNSLLEWLSLCYEEPTSLREVLYLVLPLRGWGRGKRVWRGRFLATQLPVFPGVFTPVSWPW